MTGTIELFKNILQANLPPLYLFVRIAAGKLVDHSRLGTELEGNDQLRRKPTSLRAGAIFKQTACRFWRNPPDCNVLPAPVQVALAKRLFWCNLPRLFFVSFSASRCCL